MAFRFRSYLSSVNGNTSMIFAASMMSLVVASGVAIDFGQMVTAKTSANAIADAAALAAVSLSNGTESEMKRIAKDYVDTNTKGLDFKVGGEPSFEYDAKTGEFVVELQGEVSASFLSLAGIANAGVTARSVAVKPDIPPVEMVLALDTTGSMTGSKIMALKAAASKMVKAVLKNKDAKIGIVPFSNYVNVGVSRRNNAFMDVPADYTTSVNICSDTYPNKRGCSYVTLYKPCPSNDGIASDSNCPTYTQVCESGGEVVKVCKDYAAGGKFNGCVGSRDEVVRAKINDGSKKYPGIVNATCGTEILDLTNDVSKAENKVNALTATGETYLPGGLTWGWNMLNSAEPLTEATNVDEMTQKNVRKVLVFMTDGANTLVPTTKSKGSHASPASSTYKKIDYSNTLTAELCANIKQDYITIYTVQFDVADTALQSLLTDCATTKQMSFRANDADSLVASFDSILKDLAEIRIIH